MLGLLLLEVNSSCPWVLTNITLIMRAVHGSVHRVTHWIKSCLNHSGCVSFCLPLLGSHQEIQGVGYAHHTCGRRPWLWTPPLTVLVCIATPINSQIDSQLVRVTTKSPAAQPGRQGRVLGTYLKSLFMKSKTCIIGSKLLLLLWTYSFWILPSVPPCVTGSWNQESVTEVPWG